MRKGQIKNLKDGKRWEDEHPKHPVEGATKPPKNKEVKTMKNGFYYLSFFKGRKVSQKRMLRVWEANYPNREMPITDAFIVSADTFSMINTYPSEKEKFCIIREHGHYLPYWLRAAIVMDMPGFLLFETDDDKKTILWGQKDKVTEKTARALGWGKPVKTAGLNVESLNHRFLIFIKEARHGWHTGEEWPLDELLEHEFRHIANDDLAKDEKAFQEVMKHSGKPISENAEPYDPFLKTIKQLKELLGKINDPEAISITKQLEKFELEDDGFPDLGPVLKRVMKRIETFIEKLR